MFNTRRDKIGNISVTADFIMEPCRNEVVKLIWIIFVSHIVLAGLTIAGICASLLLVGGGAGGSPGSRIGTTLI